MAQAGLPANSKNDPSPRGSGKRLWLGALVLVNVEGEAKTERGLSHQGDGDKNLESLVNCGDEGIGDRSGDKCGLGNLEQFANEEAGVVST